MVCGGGVTVPLFFAYYCYYFFVFFSFASTSFERAYYCRAATMTPNGTQKQKVSDGKYEKVISRRARRIYIEIYIETHRVD